MKVNVTELDIDLLPPATRNTGADVSLRAGPSPSLNPWAAGLPDSMQEELARRYEDLFRVYLANKDAIDRVTFWGVSDGDSWLNGWPVPGRTSYPLLFDRQLGKKAAYEAVSEAGEGTAWRALTCAWRPARGSVIATAPSAAQSTFSLADRWSRRRRCSSATVIMPASSAPSATSAPMSSG